MVSIMSYNIDKYTPERLIIQELGRRLAHIRKSQGFSQARLANVLDLRR